MRMESTELLSNGSQAASDRVNGKPPYESPQLELLGRMSDLTASGSKPGKENLGDVRGSKP